MTVSLKMVKISIKSEKFLIPPPHCNFPIVQWLLAVPSQHTQLMKQIYKTNDGASQDVRFYFRLPDYGVRDRGFMVVRERPGEVMKSSL